ncbi:Wzz/FepE/Etk N-terminal domain-containing protein [Nonomuraea lactucae]|uniref:Wzz/FepE/Etk N-terminal domain-containing protein n=1 Tax=Nonomuraea lactucae TaxID=2249762 RepID=UPI0013B3C58F|nr:Wzz/FepE/Etk N-terminal domain-containing protein [Nonomuraea lactucae]
MSLPPDAPARRSGTDLGEHLSLLRRRWLLFLGLTLAGGTTGLALLRLTPPAYTATTQVLVAAVGTQEQGNQVTNRQREPLNLDTEAQVAQSAVVAARAAKLLHAPVLAPVEVSVPPNSAVLSISVTAAAPEAAAAQSRAYAEAYLANRTAGAQAAIALQQRAMLAKLRQVNSGLDAVTKELEGLRKGTAAHTLAAHRQSVLNRQTYSLTLKYDTLKTTTVTPGSVISEAVPPGAPSSPSLPLYLGTGLMLGLLLGSAAATVRDRLDTRLRTPADVERLTGLPVIAALPGAPSAVATGPATAAEVVHDLASTVIAACPGKRLLVRAVPTGHGVSPVAGSLAASTSLSVLDGSDVGDLARADAAVLVVGLGRATSEQVAAVVHHLGRQHVPVLGVVTSVPEPGAPAPEQAVPARPSTPLGKLVAGAEQVSISGSGSTSASTSEPGYGYGSASGSGVTSETTPMQAVSHPPGRPS